jgi:hypothetical protein
VRQAVSTDAADTAEISDDEKSVTHNEKHNGKKWVASQKHVEIKKRR